MNAVVVSSRMAGLEEIVARGLRGYVAAGHALQAIRDEGLYRTERGYTSFDDYCRDHWQMSRVHAHRTIEAAQVVEVLPMGNSPATERQARELVPLKDSPTVVREVWQEVNESPGLVTAAKIREAVQRRTGESEATAVAVKPPPSSQLLEDVRIAAIRAYMGGHSLTDIQHVVGYAIGGVAA